MDLEKLRVNPFTISVKFADKFHSLKVEQSYLTGSKEIFNVIDGNVTFQITSDRPLIKANQYGRKKPTFKAVDATIEQKIFIERIISEIQSHLKRLDRPLFNPYQ